MTKKEMVIKALRAYGCSDSFQIKGIVYRMFNEEISTSSISGILRPLYAAGYVNKSNATGKTVYWLTDYGKEKL